jgi:hypothetical protein
MNPFRSRREVPENRNWVTRTPMFPDDRSAHVEEWVTQHAAFVHPENRVVALTTAELHRLNAVSKNWYQCVKPEYQAPPPSRAPSEAGDEIETTPSDTDATYQVPPPSRAQSEADDETTLHDLEAKSADDRVPKINGVAPKEGDTSSASTAANPAQPQVQTTISAAASLRLADDQYDRNHQIKDLRDILPPYTGFYMAAPNTDESMLEVGDNYSDYYGLPLIDPKPNNRHQVVKDNASVDEDSESGDEGTPINLHAPRSQPASQAILQYLVFKGLPIDNVAATLSALDAEFLYKSPSRWWKKNRFPELWELNDAVVAVALDICKADKQWWEEDLDSLGRPIPPALRLLQSRVRLRQVKTLARKSIESYLWWRLRGQAIHLDLPRAPNMVEDKE